MEQCHPPFEQYVGPGGTTGPVPPSQFQSAGVSVPIQFSNETWTTIGVVQLDALLAGADFDAAGTLTMTALFFVGPAAVGPASVRLIRVSDAGVALTVTTSSETPEFQTATGAATASAYYVQAQTTDAADVLEVLSVVVVFEV